MSRPVGSKNFYPNKRRLEEGFKESGFDFVTEFKKLYIDSPKDIQAKLILGVAEFLYPKRRAEDEGGNPEESSPQNILVATPEQLAELVKIARGKKTENPTETPA